jgi:hypothetical protein
MSNQIRLAIGTPSTGNPRIEWVESIFETVKLLTADTNLKVRDVRLLYYCSSVIPENRNNIVKMAKEIKATHLLWIDDDMRFNPEAVRALLKTWKILKTEMKESRPRILGANCIKRTYPLEYMALGFDEKEVLSYQRSGVEEVMYTGNAFLLHEMEVFDAVPEPWYAFPYSEKTSHTGTEDAYFQMKARKHGIGTYVIHELGEHIEHVGIWTFSPQHRFGGRRHLDLPDRVLDGDGTVGDLQGEDGRVPVEPASVGS